MPCLEFTDLLAVVAARAGTDSERTRVEDHIHSCPACRAEYDRLVDIVNRLDTDHTDLAPIDRLELENRILRTALETRTSTIVRSSVRLRVGLRIAATIVIFGLGYLTYPLVTRAMHSATVSESTAPAPPTTAQLRRALNSGLRFSGAGLRAITLGQSALASKMHGQ